MNPADETIIELSKKKILLLILGSFASVGLGTWLMFCCSTIWHLPLIVIQASGFISVVFFGACGIYGFKKLFDEKPGLIFNSSGIVDSSTGISAGLMLNYANYEMCGSPIAIASNSLKINFPELRSIFGQYHQKYGN